MHVSWNSSPKVGLIKTLIDLLIFALDNVIHNCSYQNIDLEDIIQQNLKFWDSSMIIEKHGWVGNWVLYKGNGFPLLWIGIKEFLSKNISSPQYSSMAIWASITFHSNFQQICLLPLHSHSKGLTFLSNLIGAIWFQYKYMWWKIIWN